MKFSLPYIDQPIKFWQEFASQYREFIFEIYFPMGEHIVPSGRPQQPLTQLYSFLERADLSKAVLVNPIVLPKPVTRLKDEILNELLLLHQYYGVNQVTVSDLQLAEIIKKELTQYQVSASVLMRIYSPEQIPYLQNSVDSLAPDTAIVRDLQRLQALREAFPGQIKLIVNEGCLPGCPFRTQHFFEMSSDLPLPASLCQNLLRAHPWLRLKSAWILPQHLYFYDNLYDIIKLAGRVTLQNPAQYLRVFQAYLERKSLGAHEIGTGPAGLTTALPISAEFFYQTITCPKNCETCSFCREYYEKYTGTTF